MMILVDPRRHLAIHPGDISAMVIAQAVDGNGEYLLLSLVSGKEFKVYEQPSRSEPRLNIREVHQRLMEATK